MHQGQASRRRRRRRHPWIHFASTYPRRVMIPPAQFMAINQVRVSPTIGSGPDKPKSGRMRQCQEQPVSADYRFNRLRLHVVDRLVTSAWFGSNRPISDQ